MLGSVSKVSLDTGNRGQYWSALQLFNLARHTHAHTPALDQHSYNSYPVIHSSGHQLSITGVWGETLA